MFDFLPLASAGRVCAAALDMKFVDFVEMRGRHQARMIAGKLPGIMGKYFDFGTVRPLSAEPKLCALRGGRHSADAARVVHRLLHRLRRATATPDLKGLPSCRMEGTVRWG
jgi:hypothetical protein